MSDKKAKPTQADRQAATKLKKIWQKLPADKKPTQEQLANRMQDVLGTGSQSAVSQYMNGQIPLNLNAVLFFADELGCQPQDIRDDLPQLSQAQAARPRSRAPAPQPRKPDEEDLNATWLEFPAELKAQLIATVQAAKRTR